MFLRQLCCLLPSRNVASFHGEPVELVEDETTKPTPTEYPPLLPTLQTCVGMVINNGLPSPRVYYLPRMSEEAGQILQDRGSALRSQCHDLAGQNKNSILRSTALNFQACAFPVTKSELLGYIRQGKRIDIEQAVAMVIGYLAQVYPISDPPNERSMDDFEDRDTSVVDDLLNDPGTLSMLTRTNMWRGPTDFDMLTDPREASTIAKKNKILLLLGQDDEDANALPTPAFTALLQTIRRKRPKLSNSQHLTLPTDLLPQAEPAEQQSQWSFDSTYMCTNQAPIPITSPRIISRHTFKKIQRLLYLMQDPGDTKSRYVLDVERFIKASGSVSPRRLAALTDSADAYAIAYSFVAAQRRRQLRVVSDHGWTRFLAKGEGKMVLQNRPDVLTSFEDILVRRASDLTALTAVACPKGVKDHFSTELEIKDRTSGVCALMERYVKDFGDGKMENLVFRKEDLGGSGRGPVDLYNMLCDELRDCKARARALGMELGIGPVHKFLAKDIMAWNHGWKDDAFADGKVPGWVEYLARVRMEEVEVGR